MSFRHVIHRAHARDRARAKYRSQRVPIDRLQLESLEARRMLANSPELFKDINLRPIGSAPTDFVAAGTTLFFTAEEPTAGRELWKSDGTEAGTMRVKDIRPGSQSSDLSNLTAVGETVYFTANDGVSGSELWKSDGTEAGTVPVKDISAGTSSSYLGYLTNVQGVLYFTAGDSNGGGLWRSDGTEAGTRPVKRISNRFSNVTSVDGVLFLIRADHTRPSLPAWELWRSDGTETGTSIVTKISSGTNYLPAPPHEFTAMGGSLFFVAKDATGGFELWKSDGSSAGTFRVKDIRSGEEGSVPSQLTNVDGTLYFQANDGLSGVELWKSDGTDAGTVQVQDIRGGSNGSYPRQLTNVNGNLFFSVADAGGNSELWKSDGTADATVRIKALRAGSHVAFPRNFTNVNGNLYFVVKDDTTGYELWKSDGTETGTVRLQAFRAGSEGSSSVGNLTNLGGTLYFRADDETGGSELWRSNGTTVNTARVRDIRLGSESSFGRPGPGPGENQLLVAEDELYFTANDGTSGTELWKTDGTVEGTMRLADLNPGPLGSFDWHVGPQLTAVGANVFLVAVAGQNENVGLEVWTTDGPTIRRVTDFGSSIADRGLDLRELTAAGGRVYFRQIETADGAGLWTSDGTVGGTMLLKTGDFDSLTNVNGKLYFLGISEHRGLWASDGTVTGTILIQTLGPGLSFGYNHAMINHNGQLFFAAAGPSGKSIDLWTSDGTTEGTRPVREIYSGCCGSSFQSESVGEHVFFSTEEALWKSDGTTAGTVRVATVGASNLTDVAGTLFFTAAGEVWKSDGTERGTQIVRDINPNPYGSYAGNLTNVGGLLYFTEDDGIHGTELWRTDGTEAGTALVADIRPGAVGSTPRHLTNFGGTLFFDADDGIHGRELWVLRPEPVPGDLDSDRDVDSADLLGFLANWTGALEPHTGEKNPLNGDLDGDADVDSADLLMLISQWTSAPPARAWQMSDSLPTAFEQVDDESLGSAPEIFPVQSILSFPFSEHQSARRQMLPSVVDRVFK